MSSKNQDLSDVETALSIAYIDLATLLERHQVLPAGSVRKAIQASLSDLPESDSWTTRNTLTRLLLSLPGAV